jgi:hypothetical protein
MNRLPRLLLLTLALAGVALSLSSCALFEPGGPSAAITVRARSSFHVTDVVERVFIDEGYQPIQRGLDGIMFERKGTKTDSVLYGNWNEGEVTQRVQVNVASRGDETYRLRCIPYVARNPHDVSFVDQHRRMQPFSLHFSSLLREVRRQCEELWLSRGTPEPGE